MKKNQLEQSRFSIYLSMIFMLFDVACNNIILGSFDKETPVKELFLFIGLLVLQIIASPIQTGVSDFYGRKKSLIISLSATLISLIILFFHNSILINYFFILILISIVKGLFGNSSPIVWAVIGDTDGKEERWLFAISTAAYAIGYLTVLFMNLSLSSLVSVILLMIIFFVLVCLCIKSFKDIKDTSCQKNISFFECLRQEQRLIIKDLKKKVLRYLYLAFFLSEVSIYCLLILYADFKNFHFLLLPVIMMIGYLFGVGVMKFCTKFSNKIMMNTGYIISILSLIPCIVLSIFFNIYYPLVIGYFFHAVGNAILSPTIFTLSIKGLEDHEKGKRLGIIESVDTLAVLISAIIIIFYRIHDLNIIYMVYFSFLTIIFSLIIFKRFEKFSMKTIKS